MTLSITALDTVTLSDIKPSVANNNNMLSVIMVNAVMLSVVAPENKYGSRFNIDSSGYSVI